MLKHIYAHAIIKPDDKEAVYEALVSTDKLAKLEANLGLWWQRPDAPKGKPQQAKPRQPRVRLDRFCKAFNIKTLKIRGNHIYNGNACMLSFRSPIDAKKAYNVIRHYNMTKKCAIGSTFSYFLSGNNAPMGAFKGEDSIPFNPSKIQVKRIGKQVGRSIGRQKSCYLILDPMGRMPIKHFKL